MNTSLEEIRKIIFLIHTFVSVLVIAFLIIGIVRAIYNRKKENNKYIKFDSVTDLLTLISLYLQMILGTFLLFIKESNNKFPDSNISDMIHRGFFRFWSVEHLIIMFFAILIAQVSYLIIKKVPENTQKSKYRLQYYAIIFFLVIFSLGFAVLKNNS